MNLISHIRKMLSLTPTPDTSIDLVLNPSYSNDVSKGITCPYCNKPTKTSLYFGKPKKECKGCKAFLVVDDVEDIGRIAKIDLRNWKREFLAFFGQLIEEKVKRSRLNQKEAKIAAYKWLGKELEIPQERLHVNLFNIRDCRRCVTLIGELFKKIRK